MRAEQGRWKGAGAGGRVPWDPQEVQAGSRDGWKGPPEVPNNKKDFWDARTEALVSQFVPIVLALSTTENSTVPLSLWVFIHLDKPPFLGSLPPGGHRPAPSTPVLSRGAGSPLRTCCGCTASCSQENH